MANLCPDDVVVAIIADRIGQPDARRGFVLDGFPRTVPQAQALDRLLAERGLKLDAVIELKVDEGILLQRIEKRAAEMTARGEKIRADDNPEVLKGAPCGLSANRQRRWSATMPTKACSRAWMAWRRSTMLRRPLPAIWSQRGRVQGQVERSARQERAKPAKRKRPPKGSARRKRPTAAKAQKQGRTAQKPYSAEVDESAMNPLISCTFRSLTRCRAPTRRGRASCYALRYPLPGTHEFGAFRATGRYRRS